MKRKLIMKTLADFQPRHLFHLRLPAHTRPAWLGHAALLTLLTFGLQACAGWRMVPLADVEGGKEELKGVKIRVKEKGSSSRRTVQVVAIDFPFVEGLEASNLQDFVDDVRHDVRIDLREVEELEVFDATTGLTILAVVGTIAAVVGGLVIALASSPIKIGPLCPSCHLCPPVYAMTPEGPVLVGEAYSGAASRSTQRADLMPLPPLPGGRTELWLANQPGETENTDQLELRLVDHAPGLRALATAEARPILVDAAIAPTRVTDLAGLDVTSLVAVQDGRFWQSDLDRAAADGTPELQEGLEAVFAAPTPGARPVLELQIGNTAWMGLVFGHLFALTGDSLDTYIAGRDDPASGPAIRAWREREGVDLSVEVLRPGGWERVGLVPPVGPKAQRRVAVPLPPSEPGSSLRVRLTGGLGFWRFDQIALSALHDDSPPSLRLAPASARQADGADVRALLAATDGRYQVLARTGEKLELTFELPAPAPGAVREAFLFTNGYYDVHSPPQSEHSLGTLQTLRQEGGLSRFSLDLYRRYRTLAVSSGRVEARP